MEKQVGSKHQIDITTGRHAKYGFFEQREQQRPGSVERHCIAADSNKRANGSHYKERLPPRGLACPSVIAPS